MCFTESGPAVTRRTIASELIVSMTPDNVRTREGLGTSAMAQQYGWGAPNAIRRGATVRVLRV